VGVAVQGSSLQVPAGETLSVVGGDIQIADGSLYAPGGRIDIVSVASPGEVLPNAPDLGVASFEQLGRIEVSHSSSSERPRVDPSLPPGVPGNDISNVDASGEGGGRIFIRGGQFVAEGNAFIFADTRGSEEGQGIDIGVTGQVTVRNGARIAADTFGSGSGGDLTVKARNLEVRNGAEISASVFGPGQGGNVTINATDITLQDGGRISAESIGASTADAGNITLEVGNLLYLSNDSRITTSAAGGTGKGGTSPSAPFSSCSMGAVRSWRRPKKAWAAISALPQISSFNPQTALWMPPPNSVSLARWRLMIQWVPQGCLRTFSMQRPF
jgi:hypothetical protein